MTAALSRRAALTGAVASVAMVGAAVVVAAPVAPTPDRAFRRLMQQNDAAERYFCAQPVDLETSDPAAFEAEVDRMIAASQQADAAVPTNWNEFTELLEHMVDDGHSSLSELNVGRLLAHARRLAGVEASA